MKMTNTTRESPLHYAASCGNVETLEAIFKRLDASQIQLGVNTQSAIGWSPLCTASARGHLKCVELMLQVTNESKLFAFVSKLAAIKTAPFCHRVKAT